MSRTLAKVIVGVAVAASMSLFLGSPAHAWVAVQHIGKQVIDTSTPMAAPEIDPASALGALTLLLGSVAVLRGRRTRK